MMNVIVDFQTRRRNPFVATKPKRSSLVVDFGHKRKSYVKPKRVHFATENQMCTYERLDEVDAHDLFYSDEDYEAMKKARIHAVNNARRILRAYDAGGIDQAINFEALRIWSIGIEKLIDPERYEKLMWCKNKCRTAVLKEQKRQCCAGEHNPDRLALASRRCSAFAMNTAVAIGRHHSR